MKHLLAKGLSALLAAALLLTGTALAEEAYYDGTDAGIVEAAAVEDEAAETEAELGAEEADGSEFTAPDYGARLMEAEGEIPIDEAHFPDPVFRDYVLHVNAYEADGDYYPDIDTDHNGALSVFEREQAERICLRKHGSKLDEWIGFGVTSLQGIEYLTGLKELDCSYNQIASMDLSALKNLERLEAHHNTALTWLDVGGLTNLNNLNVCETGLTALDVSGLSKLNYLNCIGCGMTSLTLAGCANLQTLVCSDNQLATLDLSGCPDLMLLTITGNPLSTLDVTKCRFFAQFPKGFNAEARNKSEWMQYSRVLTAEEIQTVTASIQFVQLMCDSNTTVVGANGTSASFAAPAGATALRTVEGRANATVTVAKSSTATKTTATVVAAPGAVAQLDFGGAKATKIKSSDRKVAAVSASGLVTFKKAGKVTLTCKVGKKTRTVVLKVTDPTMPKSVSLNMTGTNAAKVGEKVTLTATLNEGAKSAIQWTTSDKKVATVKGGVVTFKKAGKVTITATTKRGNKKAKVKFTVTK